jgi:hypothetical protein
LNARANRIAGKVVTAPILAHKNAGETPALRTQWQHPAVAFIITQYRFHPKEEMVQTLIEGQTIRHDQYGLGIVTESNADRTTIDFDDHGTKKFVTSIWIAELIGEPPTERPTRRRGRRKAAKKAAA